MSSSAPSQVALALVFGLASIGPAAARADDSVDKKLDRCVDFERRLSGKFDDLLEFMSKRYQVSITVDRDAFHREKMKYDGTLSVVLPAVPAIRIRTGL